MLTLKIINEETYAVDQKILDPAVNCEWIIGRTPGCDLLLESPEVSRVHGRILYRDGQYFFTDLGSTDGSRLNNEMLLPSQNIALQADDLLRICGFFLVVKSIQADANSSDAIAPIHPQLPTWTPHSEITVRCVQIIPESHDVKTFQFIAEPKINFHYWPGQFVTLQIPLGLPSESHLEHSAEISPEHSPDISPERSPEHRASPTSIVRSYSISSTPSRPHLLAITVKRVPAPVEAPNVTPGLASNWLHDHLSIGSRLQLQGPFGQFTCGPTPAPKLLLISAGSGITPMMSMTRWICDTAAETDVVFAYSTRSPQDLIFRKELELLNQQHPKLKLAVTLTGSALGESWMGYQGRMDAAMIQAIAPDFRDREVFVCGPNPFMAAIKTCLVGLDFPMDQYHEESFGAPAKPAGELAIAAIIPALLPDSPLDLDDCTLVFTQSAKTINYDEADSILEIAEAANIAIPSACRMGVCGACKQQICSGEVAYSSEPTALPPADRDRFILPCIARPRGRVVIDA